MRALLVPFLALSSLAVTGCRPVYSVHPLYTDNDAVSEPSLVGHWVSTEEDDQFCILKSKGVAYTLIATSEGTDPVKSPGEAAAPEAVQHHKLVQTFELILVQLDDQLFADVTPTGETLDNHDVELQAGTARHHIIARLNLEGDNLSYSILDSSRVSTAKEQGIVPLNYVRFDDGILLISSTEDLRWSVSRYSEQLFDESASYQRVPDPPDANPDAAYCKALPPS